MSIPSNPLPNCEKFLIATLKADAGMIAAFASLTPAVNSVKVYSIQAPQNTVYPYLIVQYYSGQLALAVGRNEAIYELPVYVVKAITKEGDTGTAHLLIRAAEKALKDAQGKASWNGEDVFIQGIRLQAPRIEYTENDTDGVRFNHVGGYFRLFVSAAG